MGGSICFEIQWQSAYMHRGENILQLRMSTTRSLRKWTVQLCSLSKGWKYIHLACFFIPLVSLLVMLVYLSKYCILWLDGLILCLLKTESQIYQLSWQTDPWYFWTGRCFLGPKLTVFTKVFAWYSVIHGVQPAGKHLCRKGPGSPAA